MEVLYGELADIDLWMKLDGIIVGVLLFSKKHNMVLLKMN